MLIANAIIRMRNDLKDVAPGDRWTDTVLTEHVAHALEDYSTYNPQDVVDSTIDAARSMSISGLTGLIDVVGIGYPTAQYPPRMRQFDMKDEETVLLQVADTSFAGKADIYYEAERAIGDLPVEHEGLLCRLAEAYALEEYAAYSTDKANDGETERFRIMGGEWKAWVFARLAEVKAAREEAKR